MSFSTTKHLLIRIGLIIKRVSFFIVLMFVFCLSCVPRQSRANVESKLPIENELISISNDSFLEKKVERLNFSNGKNSLSIATWNIQHLGRTKSNEEIAFMADVLRDLDIVAIQEVVAKDPAGAQKVAELADELNRRGAKWDYRVSDPTKSPSVYISERYAFLWKTSKVDLIGRANLDEELETVINREPYIAKFKFKKSNTDFYVINIHARTHNHQPELEIAYFNDYQNRLNSNHIIIAGDFNLNEKHPVWNDLYEQGFNSAVRNSKTTLKHKCASGEYLSHPIDNIYYSSTMFFVSSGVIDYIKSCENLIAARQISDHLPVFLQLNFEKP